MHEELVGDDFHAISDELLNLQEEMAMFGTGDVYGTGKIRSFLLTSQVYQEIRWFFAAQYVPGRSSTSRGPKTIDRMQRYLKLTI